MTKKIEKFSDDDLQDIFMTFFAEYNSLDQPCCQCNDIDCVDSSIQQFIYKKHKTDSIDGAACLNEKAARRERIADFLRNPIFNTWTDRKCMKCGKACNIMNDDIKTAFETRPSDDTGMVEMRIISLCNKHYGAYKRGKQAFLGGFKRF